MDRDEYISNGELFLVLKMMVGNNLKVRVTWRVLGDGMDTDDGGRINSCNKSWTRRSWKRIRTGAAEFESCPWYSLMTTLLQRRQAQL